MPAQSFCSGINAEISKAYTGKRAEHVIIGAIRIVTIRSREFEILLVAMIPGIAQAKLESSGIKDLPERPTDPITLSKRYAALGR